MAVKLHSQIHKSMSDNRGLPPVVHCIEVILEGGEVKLIIHGMK